jgi:hypothetical protein
MTNRHEPDPSFLTHLERETRFALRRAREDASSAQRSRLMQRLRSAALMTLSLGLGAGVVVAAQQLEDSRWIEQRLARNAIQRTLAAKKMELIRTHEQRVAQLVAAGFESNSAAREAARRTSSIEREARLLTLEHEELALGGRPPEGLEDIALTSPLVRERDFVSERLRAMRAALVEREESLGMELQLLEKYVAAGVATSGSVGPARVAQQSAARALEALDAKLALRADFVLGRIAAAECERTAMRVDAELHVADVAARVEAARDALQLADTLHTQGFASAPEAERIALAEAEAEAALAALALEVLR